ncbi:MAG: TPM domain-containing protein [Mesorhizobium sp.]|jgi:putative membrane protein
METLSAEDHRRVSEAIRQAEARTSGEIFCVLARSSGSYFFAAGFMLALAMLAVALVVAFVLQEWWFEPRLTVFAAAEMAAFACALALLLIFPSLCLRLVPRHVQYTQAHDNALRQFLARNVHITTQRTGVLLFISLAERYAAVVADAGIDRQVRQEDWDGVVAELVEGARRGRPADGFVTAIASAGALLTAHFPIGQGDPNELDDHLVEI